MKKYTFKIKIIFVVLFLNLFNIFIFSEEALTQKKALIFGITGQDGTYLTELLLNKNYQVYGTYRDGSTSFKTFNSYLEENCKKLLNDLNLVKISILDQYQVKQLINQIQPDEIYNLAAQSSIGLSFKDPVNTIEVNGMLVLYILESIRSLDLIKKTKLFQALSGDIFSKSIRGFAHEESKIEASSPYAISKSFALNLTKFYRETYDIFASNGFLFNHESPLRPEHFVSRLITKSVSEIKLGLRENFSIGNLNIQRDWGYAKDYVEAMYLMLQQSESDDYVISTGVIHSVRDMIEEAFKIIGIEIIWFGEGKDEVGLDKKTNKILVKIDQNYYRPNDNECLFGNSSKVFFRLGWKSRFGFKSLINIMLKKEFEFFKIKNMASI